jgi:hypothetical protein
MWHLVIYKIKKKNFIIFIYAHHWFIFALKDSLSFPLPSTTIDIHVPSEPTSQVQDPPNINKIILLLDDNNVLQKHLSKLGDQYYKWKVACVGMVDWNQ